MLSIIERVVRTNCVICDARSYSNTVCDACELQPRNDFYLLLLTNMKDEGESYENLKSKCLDIHDAIDHHPMVTEPRKIFDPLVDSIDFQAKHLLESYTDILNRDAVPVNVAGDGDCLFHAINSLYPELNIDELRVRCITELCLNEQYYSAVVNKMGFDLVDDESVEEHALRILNNQQYTGVLTLAALSSVLMQPIRSIYPHVNDGDEYFEILNTTFFPRTTSTEAEENEPLRIMWSGPKEVPDRDWRANHFVPLLTPRQQSTISMSTGSISYYADARNSTGIEQCDNNVETANGSFMEDQQEVEVKDVVEDELIEITFDSRQMFFNASIIVQEILDAAKNNDADDYPPKEVIYPSKFVVKSTRENRVSIGKDGNGAWLQGSSAEAALVLTANDNYQIVHRNNNGQYFYLERVGRQYTQRQVQEKDVFILKRIYATNKANPRLRRMICHLSSKIESDELNNLPLPMFLQYATSSAHPVKQLRIKPHGNATKSTRPFTSTIPQVLENVRSQPLTKPSNVYRNALQDVVEINKPNLTTVRDRTQVYNARRKDNSITEEYLTVMKRLEKANGVVARFCMNRAEAPVLVLAQQHLIKEIERCCLNANTQSPRSVLCIDTTFNLGKFFVTPTTFRNTALQNRRTKKNPVFLGPTIIHYRNDSQSYEELLDYVRRELPSSDGLVIGSDGASAIKNAVVAVFPNTTHLFCVRHVRNNIERQLMKIQLSKDERRELLENIFEHPESLIQSETEDELDRRLHGLHEVWNNIVQRNGRRFDDSSDFFTWFNRFQLETFRRHLIASIRIDAGYVDQYNAPRLFYNNDIEALNHVLKNAANWEIQSLSRIIDIIDNQITMQKNESIRGLYEAGEFEILSPYTRFVHDCRNWTYKSIEERAAIVSAYYSYQPPHPRGTVELNISSQAGRKPGKKSIRGSTTTRKTSKKRTHGSSKSQNKSQ